MENISDWNGISKFTIIGDGPLQNECIKLSKLNPKIELLGRLPNNVAKAKMAEYDYLVLPSLYDGWGAVVNEALSAGTRVLCSNACGASILIDGETRGCSFNNENAVKTITAWSKKGRLSESDRNTIRKWALQHISGEAAADYFVKIISGQRVEPPWLINKSI